jgi:hypothetical protein
LPGTFFLIIGIFWSIITSFRYIHLNSKSLSARRKNEYTGSVTMLCLFLPCSKLRRAPIESYLKFFMGLIGVFGEYLTGYDLVDIPSKKLENNSSLGHLGVHEQHSDHSFHSSSVNNGAIKIWTFASGKF